MCLQKCVGNSWKCKVSKFNYTACTYYIVHPKDSWAGLICALTNTTTASDCQTPIGQIPGDQPEQGIDGYGGKDFEKRRTEG